MALLPGDYLIDDETHPAGTEDDLVTWRGPDGEVRGRGGIPRDFAVQPPRMSEAPSFPTIPKSEWSAMLKEMQAQKATGSDLRSKLAYGVIMPSLDQGQIGYCWGHSNTSQAMLKRAQRGLPYVALSAYSVCAPIKKGRDEGGWCGLSGKYIAQYGLLPQSVWPQGDRDYTKYQKAEYDAMRAQFRATEDWMDLAVPDYDRNLTFDQLATLLLSGEFPSVDFNWWSHSVCALDLVEVEPGSFGIRILNSWGDSWGEKGTGVLRGSKAIPNGAVCLRDFAVAAA